MADTDEEQIESIKRWWDENGKSLVVGVAVALAGVFGYQSWENRVQETGESASALYEDMVAAVTLDSPFAVMDPEKLTTGKFLANQLKEEHADSTYAHFAALFLARMAVEAGDFEAAEQELNWALAHDIDDSLEVMTRIRLAKVHLATDQPDAALAALEGVKPGEHRASYEEMKGDVYLAMGDADRARESYQLAVNALTEGDVRPILQMKLEDLIAPVRIAPVDPVAVATPAQTQTEAN